MFLNCRHYFLRLYRQNSKKLLGLKSCPAGKTPATTVERKSKWENLKRKVEPSGLQRRPPIVTLMGHVDHGKTTLLDALRKTATTENEFGGITQHMGAFSVAIESAEPGARPNLMTFLDTPGHSAFFNMRSRGAHVTDVVVLVVAADDGALSQTAESLAHVRRAGVGLIVALTKIDLPTADLQFARRSLLQFDVLPEDYGGDTQFVGVSAVTGQGLHDLKEAILAEAELLDLKADYDGPVRGVVLESRLVKHMGFAATVLVESGSLRKGALLVCGEQPARARFLLDENARIIDGVVTPARPVQVVGFQSLVAAGTTVEEVKSRKEQAALIKKRIAAAKMKDGLVQLEQIEADRRKHREQREQEIGHYENLKQRRRLVHLLKRQKAGESRIKEDAEENDEPQLNVLINADVPGSVEAIVNVLATYNDPRCRLNVMRYGAGPPTDEDLVGCKAFDGVLYLFNLPDIEMAGHPIQKRIKELDVKAKHFNIIYRLFEDVERELSCRLPAKIEEDIIGEATVLQVFRVPAVGSKGSTSVGGCRCTSGELQRKAFYRLVRTVSSESSKQPEEEVVFDGQLISLRHHKDDVSSVITHQECGIMFDGPTDLVIRPGDCVVCYKKREVPQTVDWNY